MPHVKRTITLPRMTPGTDRQIVVHRFGRAGARPKVYLQAAIHANELPGAMLLHHLMPLLVAADRAVRIVMLRDARDDDGADDRDEQQD